MKRNILQAFKILLDYISRSSLFVKYNKFLLVQKKKLRTHFKLCSYLLALTCASNKMNQGMDENVQDPKNVIFCGDIFVRLSEFMDKLSITLLSRTNKNTYSAIFAFLKRQNRRPLRNYFIFQSAIERESISIAEYALSLGVDINRACAMAIAARTGNLEMLSWLKQKGAILRAGDYNDAISGSGIATLEWLKQNKCPFHPKVNSVTGNSDWPVITAIHKLNFDALIWLSENGFVVGENALVEASKFGTVEIVKYLVEQKGLKIKACCPALAAENNKIEIVNYFFDFGIWPDTAVVRGAIKAQNMEFLKYLIYRGCPVDDSIICYAASVGSIEIADYLLQIGCKKDPRATKFAARHGHTKMVQFLLNNNFPKNELSFLSAVSSGDMDTIIFLTENQFPGMKEACTLACANNEIDIVEYFLKNKCPLSEEYILAAHENSNFLVVKYLVKMKCPYNMHTLETIRERDYCLEILDYLIKNAEFDCSSIYSLEQAHNKITKFDYFLFVISVCLFSIILIFV